MFREMAAAGRVYIIAELAANHNGNMEYARKMIRSASLAKADCVKFQSWSKDSIFSKVKYEENCFIADDYRNRKDMTLEQSVEKYAISEVQLMEMREYCDSLNIEMTSTPFNAQELGFLTNELRAKFIKVASMDLNNVPLLRHVGSKALPVVISTGMGSIGEIDSAVNILIKAGSPEVAILHCVSEYPPQDSLVHFRKMETLHRMFPDCAIGFSDHTLGTIMPIAAIALGATIVEKHITLDKNLPGWDHKVSATPDELVTIVEAARRIPAAMGSSRVEAVESADRIREFRRSLVAARPIAKGDRITPDMLDSKRPARGIEPDMFDHVVGRIAAKDIGFDDIIYPADLV